MILLLACLFMAHILGVIACLVVGGKRYGEDTPITGPQTRAVLMGWFGLPGLIEGKYDV